MPFNLLLELIVILKVVAKVAEFLIYLCVFSVSSSKDSEGDLFCKSEMRLLLQISIKEM